MKNIILTLVIALLSCNSNDDNRYNNIVFSLIGQGQLHGNGVENIEKSNLIIENTTAWDNLINKMNTVNTVSENFNETEIDFSQYMVIAVFDEIYNNGGHSIDIIKIMENEVEIIVTVDKLLNGDVSTVITQPYHIIKIPLSKKSIIFEENTI